METTIKINTSLLSNNVLEEIKKMFPNKKVIITIREAEDQEDYNSSDE